MKTTNNAAAPKHDDFDLPDDVPPDPVLESQAEPQLQTIAPNLQLGPAEVKPYDRNAWIREFGPNPPTVGMRIMDFAIVAMFAGSLILFIKACSWAITG